jgi:hypothetical protein
VRSVHLTLRDGARLRHLVNVAMACQVHGAACVDLRKLHGRILRLDLLLTLGRLRMVIRLLDEVLQFLVAFVRSSAGRATDAAAEAGKLLKAVEPLLFQD